MGSRENKYVAEFDESLKGWTDHRFVSANQVRDLAMFHLYLVNLSEADGWRYDGHSWKESASMGCLTVKATVDGVPSVVFTSARTSANGIRIFLRKLEGEMLEWIPDKYRT